MKTNFLYTSSTSHMSYMSCTCCFCCCQRTSLEGNY